MSYLWSSVIYKASSELCDIGQVTSPPLCFSFCVCEMGITIALSYRIIVRNDESMQVKGFEWGLAYDE